MLNHLLAICHRYFCNILFTINNYDKVEYSLSIDSGQLISQKIIPHSNMSKMGKHSAQAC